LRIKPLVISVLTFLVLASVWEFSAGLGLYNSSLLPPPSEALQALVKLGQEGILGSDFSDSMWRYIPGFVIGSLIGVILGTITGISRNSSDSISPLFHYLRSIPPVALVPFILVIFGINDLGKVSLVAWACMFPVWLSTQAGMRQVPVEYLHAAKVFGIKGLRSITNIWLPSSVPHIMNGLRISIATGLFALVAAEMFASSSGIGFRIVYSHQIFETDAMVGMILLLGLIALLADTLLSRLSKTVVRWRNV
jgi:ABC-type nitrate/sulfonate/bicarbonate transport system permease component